MSSQIVKGSLTNIANERGTSVAETFVHADTIIVVDVSNSMLAQDTVRNGQQISRYTAAINELAKLQNDLPGKIAVVAFSDTAQFCPTGIPTRPNGSTDLAEALQFVHIADGCSMHYILISDGEPNDERAAIQVAHRFQSRIDTVFVGPEGSPGQAFLQRLADACSGTFVLADRTRELADNIQQLLLTA